MINSDNIYPDLPLVDDLVFKPCRIAFSNFERDLESQAYAACSFQLNGQKVKFRSAKITPTKIGQFVTTWHRNEKGITEPFNVEGDFDFLLIATRKEHLFGIFIFPKAVLHDNKILSGNSSEGKRGIRVYPTWDLTINKQAQRTQGWQTKHFLELTAGKLPDLKNAKRLFNIDPQASPAA